MTILFLGQINNNYLPYFKVKYKENYGSDRFFHERIKKHCLQYSWPAWFWKFRINIEMDMVRSTRTYRKISYKKGSPLLKIHKTQERTGEETFSDATSELKKHLW